MIERAYKLFQKTEFEDMASAKLAAGIDTPTGSSVATDGENVTFSQSKEFKAGIVGVSVSSSCNSDTGCSSAVTIAKGLSFIDADLASAQASGTVTSNGDFSGALKGKVVGHYITGGKFAKGAGASM